MALDLVRPRRVVIGFPAMLAPIEFHDQLSLDANEVDRVTEERNLSTELQPVEAAVSEQRPEDVFGFRRPGAQVSGEAALFGGHGTDDAVAAGRGEPLSRMGEGQG